MADLRVPDNLWANMMEPEGSLERWIVADGARVSLSQTLAEIRVEDALHDVMAPVGGRLTQSALVNDVLEPGTLLGHVTPLSAAGD